MSPENLQIYAQIQSLTAKMEGLKAENKHCVSQGDYPPYREDYFAVIAVELQSLADQVQQEDKNDT